MKILIDARELRTTSGRYVERLTHYLQQLDNTNDYTLLMKPQDIANWLAAAKNFATLPCSHKEFSFAEQLGLKRQVQSQKADLVHFTFPQQPVLYSGKTVTTIHDLTTLRFVNPDKNPLVFRIKQKIYALVIKRSVRKAEHVIVPSQFVKDDLAAFARIDPAKITVTYEAADPITEPATPLPDLQNKNFIMYIGRPTPHKNLDRLIEAFSLLKANHPDLLLVLAGKKDANYRRIEQHVQKQQLQGVVFADFVSEGQLRWLYEQCAAYVFPSLSEGFGLPGLEAMQHGAPVVSSNATCLPEIYGQAARFFDPLNTNAIAAAINEVLNDPKLRDELIKKGHEQVARYSWQRMAEETLAIYQSALEA